MDKEIIHNKPSVIYSERKPQQGKGKDFDFDTQFAKGLTIDEAKTQMHRRIKLWKWEK